jgi:hypothetical protein
MERSNKRGKIPQQDWPSIIKRYEAGETLASIAKTYDCSPPAISYIVSRSRARESAAGDPADRAESTFVTGHTGEALSKPLQEGPALDKKRDNLVEVETSYPVAALSEEPQHKEDRAELIESAPTPDPSIEAGSRKNDSTDDPPSEVPRDAKAKDERSGSLDRANAAQNLGQRRTLHLPQLDAGVPGSDPQLQNAGAFHASGLDERSGARSPESHQHGFPQPGASPPPVSNGGPVRNISERHTTTDGGNFIGPALRERVGGDVTAFLAAFDAALAQDTLESRSGLREATDRLLRAGARTRIELERLEARLPLPPRENTAQATRPAFARRS